MDGHPSHDATTDAFNAFAHHVHDDLHAARLAGRIPPHVEITVSLANIEAQATTPAGTLLSVRFRITHDDRTDTALGQRLKHEAITSMDRRGVEHLAPTNHHQYAGFVFLVDERDQPIDYRPHSLSI